jgi:hypothetical protein
MNGGRMWRIKEGRLEESIWVFFGLAEKSRKKQ